MSARACSNCGSVLAADTTAGICQACESNIEKEGFGQGHAATANTVVFKTPNIRTGEDEADLHAKQDHLPLGAASGDVDLETRLFLGAARATEHDGGARGQTNSPRRFGDYELLGEIARGGMGVVYKARQINANRVVALKMILKGDLAFEDDIQRFYVEARSAAHLQHPNIVPVYDVGEQDGRHYFAMGYVKGQSLADRLREGPLSPREAVRLITAVAEAVEYAHAQGIVHRDLKPANVLIDSAGQPMITDFGLAKNRMDDSGLTATGQILGTPSFMPPEQAMGRIEQVGPLADVYSLGATLYHMLTGRPPFLAPSLLDTLQQVLHQEPVPPSQIDAAIDKDLETICLKCLQKEQSKRYASAHELVVDLSHWQNGEPIAARPVGRIERSWRWCRRNPVIAILSTAAVALLVLGTVVSTFFAVIAQRREGDALQLAQANKKLADDENLAKQAAKTAHRESELRLIDMYTHSGLQADKLDRPAEAIFWFSEAAHLSADDMARQQANRLRFEMWSRSIPLPTRAFLQPGEPSTSRTLTFHDSGRFLMIQSQPDICVIWDIETEKRLQLPCGDIPVAAATWSPDGRWLVLSGSQHDVSVYRFPEGDLLHKIAFSGTVRDLEFNQEGNQLAIAGDGVRVWDCRTLEFATALIGPREQVSHVVFTQRGDKLGTACLDGLARVYEISGGREPPGMKLAFPPVPHVDGRHFDSRICFEPVFLNNGSIFATRTNWDTVTCWSTVNGEKSYFLNGVGNLFGMCASPNSRYLAIYGFAGARFWDAASSREAGNPMRHSNFIRGASFSRDGQALLTVSGDRTSGLWDVPSGAPITSRMEHQDTVCLGNFSPDGQYLATIQTDNLVRVWKRSTDAGRVEIRLNYGDCGFALSSDGRSVLPAGWKYSRGEPNPTVFDTATGDPQTPPLAVGGFLNAAAFSPDGQSLLTAGSSSDGLPQQQRSSSADLQQQEGSLKFWRWRQARIQFDPLSTPSEPVGAAYSPDGQLAVAICAGGQILMIDATTGKGIRQLDQQQQFVVGKVNERVKFSPDGTVFATWLDSTVRVWKAGSGELQYELQHGAPCCSISFSNDSRFIATASVDKSARVWNVVNGYPASPTLAHPDWVFCATFSPDGELLATACLDQVARIWNWRSGKVITPPMKHNDEIFQVHISQNANWLFTASRDFSMRFWDTGTGLPATPSLAVAGWPYFGELVPDSNRAIVSTGRSLLIVDGPDLKRARTQLLDNESLRLFGELVSGRQLHERGGVNNLTSDEWLQRWRTFRNANPNYQSSLSSEQERRSWHDKLRKQCEFVANAEGTLFHLDRLIQMDPRKADLYRHRCIAHAALAKWDRANADLLQAIDLMAGLRSSQPENALLQYQFASMQLKLSGAGQTQCPPSRNSSKPSLVVFDNQSEGAVALNWVDSEGIRHPFGRIQPRGQHPQVTYSGHSWLLTDEHDSVLGHFIATDLPAHAVITSK